jgi:hypothetical protein
MGYQFQKHYSRDEARALLPQIRAWLNQIHEDGARLQDFASKFTPLLEAGADAGGPNVNQFLRVYAELRTLLAEFARREIQIKDLDRGLIDFPALRAGREVFLCWEKDEDDIEFWHDLESGYAGRERW